MKFNILGPKRSVATITASLSKMVTDLVVHEQRQEVISQQYTQLAFKLEQKSAEAQAEALRAANVRAKIEGLLS